MHKVLIWMSTSSHHQTGFFNALRQSGRVDLGVCYDHPLSERRTLLGWHEVGDLPEGERYVEKPVDLEASVPDWRERIHVIPGARAPVAGAVLRQIIRAGSRWVHWSECRRHGLRRIAGMPRWMRYARQITRTALGAFAIGDFARSDLRKLGVPIERIAFLPYTCDGLDPAAPCDETIKDFANGRRLFLFCGALCKRKAPDVLLRSYAELQTTDWVLALVGPDVSGGKHRRLAETLGIAERVLFRGTMPADKIANVIQAADVMILPSREDGWGVVLNEAASLGRALIASDCVGAGPHMIRSGENGYIVRAADPGSLANAMRAYVKMPQLAQQHGAASSRIFEAFTPQRNAQRFITALEGWLGM